ncbi:MAG: AMP-binding protein, partial [Pseudonocardiaceae bacterium]|nr:AMP-binding protein [Pseudonocardiaceae bacterium]
MAGYDPSAFRDVFESHFTYLAGFRRNVHRYARAAAMHDPITDRTWTFGELGADVDGLAASLADAGLQPDEVVVYQLLNGPEFAMLYLASHVCGAVGAPINFRLAPGETGYIIDDSKPHVFVYDTALTEQTHRALELAEHRPALLVAVGEGEPLPGTVRFAELLSGGTPPAVLRGAYDETTRLYTSG